MCRFNCKLMRLHKREKPGTHFYSSSGATKIPARSKREGKSFQAQGALSLYFHETELRNVCWWEILVNFFLIVTPPPHHNFTCEYLWHFKFHLRCCLRFPISRWLLRVTSIMFSFEYFNCRWHRIDASDEFFVPPLLFNFRLLQRYEKLTAETEQQFFSISLDYNCDEDVFDITTERFSSATFSTSEMNVENDLSAVARLSVLSY